MSTRHWRPSWLDFTVTLSMLPIFPLWIGVLTSGVLCLSLHAYFVLSVTRFFCFLIQGSSNLRSLMGGGLSISVSDRKLDPGNSSHIWMWELGHKERQGPKNWCFWNVVQNWCFELLEKALESPLECKDIQPVHPKGNQSWIFIRRTDVEDETPILWPFDVKNWLIGKDPDAGQD